MLFFASILSRAFNYFHNTLRRPMSRDFARYGDQVSIVSVQQSVVLPRATASVAAE